MRDSKRGLTSEEATEISDVMLRSIGDVVHTKTNNLSKFPSEHLYKWLYTMGFPHEGASDSIQGSAGTSKDCNLLVDTVRGCSHSDLIGMGFEPLTVGFANHVWATSRSGQDVVVKCYTELAYLRVDAEAIGCVDKLAGERGAGPRVLFSNPQGLIMERVDGRTLEEIDMHKGHGRLMDLVARAIASLHQLPVPTVCGSSPMVWRTIDKMIETAKRRPELWPQGMPSSDEVCREIVASRQLLEVENFPVVLCHGDFKPSNVILNAGEESVTIIDHELAGPNYRGFDLMKIFRTDSQTCSSSMRMFFQSYLKSTGQPGSDAQLAALVR